MIKKGSHIGNLKGVIAPIVTPFNADGDIAIDIWVEHAFWVLDQGAHYLSPFGTTGEALSISIDQRMVGLEALIDAGISPNILMPGTGLTSVADTIALTKHASDLGVRAVMILPSFFYTDASEAGQFYYFESLLKGIGNSELKICLYNIPKNTGVPISPNLAGSLCRAYPHNFVAYKDSTGSWKNTSSVIKSAVGLAVFPGTETLMEKAMQNGGAGCISASMNLNARAIRSVFEAILVGDENKRDISNLRVFRQSLQNAELIPAIKSVLSVKCRDPRWLNLKPPLLNTTVEQGAALLAELGELGAHIRNR